MSSGFQMLEQGQFGNAKLFFDSVLRIEPENLTAQLCYGRATGLSGNPQDAISIFSKLLKIQSDNLEFQLNYAECLLWNKQFNDAKNYYSSLLKNNPNNFPTLLGLGNSFSNLKNYPEAIKYLKKAMALEPNNFNAKNSLKYTILASAFELSNKNKYDSALYQLDQIFVYFSKDYDALLAKSNVYFKNNNIPMMIKQLELLKNINEVGKAQYLNGMILAYYKIENLFKAKKYVGELQQFLTGKNNLPTSIRIESYERIIQYYIWKNKIHKTTNKIKEFEKKFPDQKIQTLALKAQQAVYNSKFTNAEKLYQKILKLDSNSFDGNLGLAAVYLAQNQFDKTEKQLKVAQKIFPIQKDVVNFANKYENMMLPSMQNLLYYSWDKGENVAQKVAVNFEWHFQSKLKYIIDIGNRKTENTQTQIKASSLYFGHNFEWMIKPKLLFTIGIAGNQVDHNLNIIHRILWNSKLEHKISPRINLQVGLKQELQDFNADLLKKNILMSHYYGILNISSSRRLGLYSQYYYTNFSDLNLRKLWFSSLYYNVNKVVKVGVNYQRIDFKLSKAVDYFSPTKFWQRELFLQIAQFENPDKHKHFLYNLLVAPGVQNIESINMQNTLRAEGRFGYKFNHHFSTYIYGMYSNIASSTASGFVYNEVGLNIKYKF